MYALILNPSSGSGRALRELPRIEALLEQEQVEYRVDSADKPGDLRAFAARAVEEGLEGIIALGGDGTLFEILNGMARSDLTLLLACCGTGNDFSRLFRLPNDPVEALRMQLHLPLSRIDIGRMNEFYFLNVAGTGLDVEVLVQAEKYKFGHSGLGPYLRGLRDAIRFFRPTNARLIVDGEAEVSARFTILSLGNGRYIGGGMKAVPNAKPDDGLLDLVLVRPVKKWQIGALLALYVSGLYVKTPMAKVRRVRTLEIACPGMTVNLDGELKPCDRARFEILPAALRVRLPGLAPERRVAE